jgi:hypothetical protein
VAQALAREENDLQEFFRTYAVSPHQQLDDRFAKYFLERRLGVCSAIATDLASHIAAASLRLGRGGLLESDDFA